MAPDIELLALATDAFEARIVELDGIVLIPPRTLLGILDSALEY